MAVAGSPSGGWDFFVSYTQVDRAWAEWIAWILEEDGHRVLVQAWDFVPGTNWVQGIQAGARDAARTIAVLSPDYLTSVYGGAEWQAAWASDPQGTGRRLLTVRVADCDRPGLLTRVVGVDLFGLGEAAAKARLRDMVSAAIIGRAKPGTPPAFPSAVRAMPHAAGFPGALPQIWKVPARNPHFTGRDAELKALEHALAAGATVSVHSVHGMGGVGETQLATEYAHTRALGYDLVWWVAAEQPATIPDQFAALAARLGLDPPADQEALRVLVHDRLRAVPGWLLVFDNADRVEDIEPWLPGGPMPAGIPGHVIVTTRRGGFASLGPVLDLDVIGLPDAARILQARVPDLDQDTAEHIAEDLGRLPLALEQAAGWLDRSQMPGQEYRELLRSRAADLYTRGRVSGRDDTIATLWDISVSRIATESPAAVQLLGVCAYLAPEPVPLDLFTTHSTLLPAPLASAAADPLAFADVIAVLVDYSLAKRTSAGLQTHRLVLATTRARHDKVPAPPEKSAERQQLPGRVPPRQEVGMTGHPLTVALRLLKADAPTQIQDAPEDWLRWAVLLPHVLTATGYLLNSQEQANATAWAEAVRGLACEAARYLLKRGDFRAAQNLARELHQEWARQLGPYDPSTLAAATHLGTALRHNGRFQEAKELDERTFARRLEILGPDHPDTLTSANNLACDLADLGDCQAACELDEDILARRRAIFGPDHPDTLSAAGSLAAHLRRMGNHQAARELNEDTLTRRRAVLGPDHPDTLWSANYLAIDLRNLGEHEAARELNEDTLTRRRAVLGPDHPDTLWSANYLAIDLRNLGEHEAARELNEDTLARRLATLGPDHPHTLWSANNLAFDLIDLGEDEAARELNEDTLARRLATLGPDHPDTRVSVDNLLNQLSNLGEKEAASRLFRKFYAKGEARS